MSVVAAAARVLLPPRIRPPTQVPEGRIETLAGSCMGTTWQVRAVLFDEAPAALKARIAGRLDALEAQMSHFRPASELCAFARLPAGASQPLSADFAAVMRCALQVAQRSDGAFDPTLADAIEAWGFGPGRHYRDAAFCPSATPPAAGGAWRRLRLERDRLHQPGGVALNLSAIAKGYAVDAVAELLAAAGIANYLVEVGGELRGAGMKPDLQPWWVALESPAADSPLAPTRIALHGLAVATSGDYRRHYRHGARQLQHTLDPRRAAPVDHRLASVSVIHERCMEADAWATALMVRGPADGLALAERLGLRALLQWRDADGRWREAASRAFLALQAGA